VIIEIHGGGFHGGTKSQFGTYLQTGGTDGIVEKALRSGISVVSLKYRLSSVTTACCEEEFIG
jgi:hypothetical protein